MKNSFFGLLLVVAGSAALSACENEDTFPAPLKEDLPLIFPERTPGKDTINLENARYSQNALRDSAAANPQGGFVRPVIEFTINPTQRDIKLRTVEVYKSYAVGNGSGAYTPTPRVKVREYNTFPAVYTENSDELFTGLTFRNDVGALLPVIFLQPDGTENPNSTRVNITNNSAVVFTFEYILEDGRRIVLTPLTSGGAITGTFISPPYSVLFVTSSGYGL